MVTKAFSLMNGPVPDQIPQILEAQSDIDVRATSVGGRLMWPVKAY